ncbi:MAG: RagB/SusD family nutrient uptake outer membrane protein [Bacteroidales bacterium]|nr:RagB/SusD family nutrient uptake outer membrane protein [Bacteroidales bacterium]MDY6001238.1 RagB/SusD family nutrient uptake outer membrane protein [Candidatus Cryptobacteroides sp.]
MKNIIKILSFVIASSLLISCNGYLDTDPTDRVSDKMLWSNEATAEYAVNNLYSYLASVNGSQFLAGMTESLTDEFKYGSYNYNSLCYIPSEFAYGGSTLTSNYVDVYMGVWESRYTQIRRTNENIHNLKKYGDGLGDNAKTQFEAEMRFIRAWLYFDLVKRYKEVIIYDEDLSKISKDKALDTEEKAWDFIQSDLEYAASKLPTQADANGRLDKGAAYAFMTRAMLYAGRWQAVVDAANKVMGLGYKLNDSYADSFKITADKGNPEAILEYEYNLTVGGHDFDSYYTPGGDFTVIDKIGGGYGTPTQEMVESYELAGGGFPDWSPWHNTDGTMQTPPYANLEPRFQATVLYNGASWKGRKIEPYVGGTDGWCQWNVDKEPKGRTTTGYYLRKLVDENHDLSKQSSSSQPLILIRYAEVLLNKAEACYRRNNATDANVAIKAIRSRVGLPYSDKNGDALWTAIRQERKVELAYEGLWYWDLRRWGDASKAYPIGLNAYQAHGLKIEKIGSDYLYTYVSVDDKDRNFPEKLYRLPLPSSELTTNSMVNQYPEWQ